MLQNTRSQTNQLAVRYSCIIQTPLGLIQAIADEQYLYALSFIGGTINPTQAPAGSTQILELITEELKQYFMGTLFGFSTPIYLDGTPFQKLVWNALCSIPLGETCSYRDIAQALGSPKACRAVGGANNRNKLAIIVPCHRVINTNGQLNGYRGGVALKQSLLDHERQLVTKR